MYSSAVIYEPKILRIEFSFSSSVFFAIRSAVNAFTAASMAAITAQITVRLAIIFATGVFLFLLLSPAAVSSVSSCKASSGDSSFSGIPSGMFFCISSVGTSSACMSSEGESSVSSGSDFSAAGGESLFEKAFSSAISAVCALSSPSMSVTEAASARSPCADSSGVSPMSPEGSSASSSVSRSIISSASSRSVSRSSFSAEAAVSTVSASDESRTLFISSSRVTSVLSYLTSAFSSSAGEKTMFFFGFSERSGSWDLL